METPNTVLPPVSPAPSPTVAEFNAPVMPPTPPPAPVAPAPAFTPSPMPVSSFSGGSGKFDPIKDINWMETIFLGAALGAICWTISYYRYKLKEDKLINSDTQRQIDNMNRRVGNLETGFTKLTTPQNQAA